MQLTDKKSDVQMSGDITPRQFTIKASRKAFEILSSGLYSDRVRAIIRELSTNAADSHVQANNPKPFEVHLPNNLEPWFSVTDWGTGLSDEAIFNVYTKYFESDKTHSNDLNGCLGLGSKSPFSYTDSFTVESRFNGVKRIYNAFLDEDKLPNITKLAESPTVESNGLKVQFPVKSGDFWEFRNKAAETLQWFSNRPKVTGAHGFEYENREYLRKTETYGVHQGQTRQSYAVMGNIAYPLSAHEFLTDYESDTMRLKKLIDWGVELYVKIGDVDISASREKLGYDKRTIRFLRQRLTEALADLEKEVTKEISTKPTIWQARMALHQVRNSFQGFNFTAEWNGEKINPYVKIVAKELEIADPTAPGGKRWQRTLPATLEILSIKSRTSSRMIVKKDHGDTIHADGTPIFLNDERGSFSGVRRYLEEKSCNKVYFISEYTQEWLKESGVGEVAIKASTLPKPERQKGGGSKAAQKAKVYEYVASGTSDNGSSSAGRFWQPAEIDLDEGGVFVEILYFNFRNAEGEATKHPNELRRPLDLLTLMGKNVKLYGIRPADKELLNESEGEWVSLKDTLTSVAESLTDTHYNNLVKRSQAEELFEQYSNNGKSRAWFGNFDVKSFSATSTFGIFLTKVREAEKMLDDKTLGFYRELRNVCNLPDVESQTLLDELKGIWEVYPLLRYINGYDHDFRKAVADYINLIDAQNVVANAA